MASCLDAQLAHACFTVTLNWATPYTLNIAPVGALAARTVRPQIVRLGSAVVTAAPTTPIDFGSMTWSWTGGDTVTIHYQAGLVGGVQYTLTFEVVG